MTKTEIAAKIRKIQSVDYMAPLLPSERHEVQELFRLYEQAEA